MAGKLGSGISPQENSRQRRALSWSSGHAEQLLFSCLCSKVSVYRSKCQCFFFDIIILSTLPCYFTVHRAGSQLKMSECQTKAGNQISLSHSHSLTASHSFTLSLSHSLTLSQSHSLTVSHSLTLVILNNFCFHVYAQKSHSLSNSHTLTLQCIAV